VSRQTDPPPDDVTPQDRHTCRVLLIACVFGWLLIASVLFSAPNEIDRHDQARQGLYVVDVFYHTAGEGRSFWKRFFVQRDSGKHATKPPLYTWLCLPFALVQGEVNSQTIRYPAALAALGVMLLTFSLGRRVGGAPVGFGAAWCLMTNMHFGRLSTMARTDMLLCFFMLGALVCFLNGYGNSEKRRRWYMLMWLSMGLGTLTKGPVGIAVPLLGISAFLALERDWRGLRELRWRPGILIAAGVVALWLVPAAIVSGKELFQVMIVEEIADRVRPGGSKELGTPWYYIPKFLYLMLPWTLLVLSAVLDELHAKRARVLLVWAAVVFLFFSSVLAGQRKDYIFPMQPAIAVLIALSLLNRSKWASRAVLATSVVVAVIGLFCMLSGAFPELVIQVLESGRNISEKLRYKHLAGLKGSLVRLRWLNIVCGCSMIGGAAMGIAGSAKRRSHLMLAAMILAGLATIILSRIVFAPSSFYGTVAARARFCEKARETTPRGAELLVSGEINRSVLFLLRWNRKPLAPQRLAERLGDSDKPVFVVMRESTLLKLPQENRDALKEVLRSKPFVTKGRPCVLVALTNRL